MSLMLVVQEVLEQVGEERVAAALREEWPVIAAVLGVAAGLRLALSLARRFARGRLERPGEPGTGWDAFLLRMVERTGLGFTLVLALAIVPRLMNADPALEPAFRLVGSLAAFWQTALWANAGISFGIRRLVQQGGEDRQVTVTAATALGFMARVLLFVLLLLATLDALGVQVTTLVAGLGIGGVVVALALQSVLTDVMGALAIVLNRPFLVGDFIQAGPHMGTVEYVGLRSTRIRSLSGQELHLPNTFLLQNAIVNASRLTERRVALKVVLAYDTPLAVLERVGGMVEDIVAGVPVARFDRAHLASFSPWGYEFEIVYWILSSDYRVYMDARERINLELLRQLDAAGVRLGAPGVAPQPASAVGAGAELLAYAREG